MQTAPLHLRSPYTKKKYGSFNYFSTWEQFWSSQEILDFWGKIDYATPYCHGIASPNINILDCSGAFSSIFVGSCPWEGLATVEVASSLLGELRR